MTSTVILISLRLKVKKYFTDVYHFHDGSVRGQPPVLPPLVPHYTFWLTSLLSGKWSVFTILPVA